MIWKVARFDQQEFKHALKISISLMQIVPLIVKVHRNCRSYVSFCAKNLGKTMKILYYVTNKPIILYLVRLSEIDLFECNQNYAKKKLFHFSKPAKWKRIL